MSDWTSVDLGLLAIRSVIAAVLFIHAAQKTVGWFSGNGLAAAATSFERMGQHPGRVMVLVAALSELGTAVLLALGLLVPLAVSAGIGTMLVAGVSVTRLAGTVWNARGGGEYPFFIAAVIATVGLAGPGSISLDAELGSPLFVGNASRDLLLGGLAIGLGVLGAVPPLMRARSAGTGPDQASS